VALVPSIEAAISDKDRTLYSKTGLILMIVSGLVLAIACVNTANLLLARAGSRRREITVRLAMGAGRWQLMRQLVAESLLLSVAGSAAGLLFASWSRDVLWSMRPPPLRRAGFEMALDGRVLAYAIAVAMLTGAICGLVPALRATSVNLAENLKERGAGQSFGSHGGWQLRSVLVVCQIALSMIALVGAGLFMRSLHNASGFNPGFDAAHLGFVDFNLPARGYPEARGREFVHEAMRRIGAMPGVDSVAFSRDQPFRVALRPTLLLQGREGASGDLGHSTLASFVSPGYLQTMRIPLLRGRDFDAQDTPSKPRVAIVNEAAAAAYWPGISPVGQTVGFFGQPLTAEIVGVARNANYQSAGETPQALIYLCSEQFWAPYGVFYLHSTGDPTGLAAEARRQVRAIDPLLLVDSTTVSAQLHASLWAQRLFADLLAIFGGLALLLATVGIYGVVNYSVHLRTRELGIRTALGASPEQLRSMVLAEGVRLAVMGVAAGAVVSLAGTYAIRAMLFGVSPLDAVTFLAVPVLLTAVAAVACLRPARRAARVDPAIALRDE
jgi:predicted permease